MVLANVGCPALTGGCLHGSLGRASLWLHVPHFVALIYAKDALAPFFLWEEAFTADDGWKCDILFVLEF